MTTTSITAVSVLIHSAHSTLRLPTVKKLATITCASWPPRPTWTNETQANTIDMNSNAVVITSAERVPMAAGSWECPSWPDE